MKKVHLTVFIILCLTQFSFAQWTVLPSGTQKDLHAIDFFDTMHGVAVGDSATVLITSDGGSSWTPANNDGIKGSLRSVQMLHPDTILIGSGSIFESQLYRSVDGGQSWQSTIQATKVAQTRSRLTAFNYEHAFYSDDRGAKWDTTGLDIGGTVLMEDLYFAKSDTGYLTGNVSGFTTYSTYGFRSVDGGLNWAPLWVFDLPNNNAAMSFTAPDPDTAYLFTNQFVNYVPGPINQLVRLTDFYFDDSDNRNSWRFTAEILQTEMPVEFISSYFSNTQFGFAGSREGSIYRTTDGGRSWDLDFEVDSSIYEITAADDHIFFAVGANGVILKNALDTSTDDRPQVLRASLYPNPVHSWLYLKDMPVAKGDMKLYSISGQLLKTGTWTAGDPIEVSDLPAGMYILNIRTSRENYLAKFQKQ
ncbi:MAG: YCF48-related protein [Saprospiraceae bacterium]|nr:T9SS type A sorting domain-containing protein [Lewinella sp.]